MYLTAYAKFKHLPVYTKYNMFVDHIYCHSNNVTKGSLTIEQNAEFSHAPLKLIIMEVIDQFYFSSLSNLSN